MLTKGVCESIGGMYYQHPYYIKVTSRASGICSLGTELFSRYINGKVHTYVVLKAIVMNYTGCDSIQKQQFLFFPSLFFYGAHALM